MNTSCKIDTGDWIGNAWNSAPEWTPYAQAIADYYPIQVPWFLTSQIILQTPPATNIPRVVITRPQLYDVLIFGMSSTQSPTIAQVGQPYLNIFHQETGMPWVSASTIGYAPLAAFANTLLAGGIAGGPPVMAIKKLPDAFFLPAHSLLKLEWMPITGVLNLADPVTVNLTMVGVQLINHRPGFRTPETITMPNGDVIPVGSRVPWFGCVPYGNRIGKTFGNTQLAALTQGVSYFPPNDCNVEIHDAYASFLDSTFEFGGTLASLRTKLDDTRTREDWTPQFAPVQAVYGSLIETDTSIPFTKPQLLKTDHKLSMVAQSNDSGANVTRGTVTFRGVRLCRY